MFNSRFVIVDRMLRVPLHLKGSRCRSSRELLTRLPRVRVNFARRAIATHLKRGLQKVILSPADVSLFVSASLLRFGKLPAVI